MANWTIRSLLVLAGLALNSGTDAQTAPAPPPSAAPAAEPAIAPNSLPSPAADSIAPDLQDSIPAADQSEMAPRADDQSATGGTPHGPIRWDDPPPPKCDKKTKDACKPQE